MINGGIYKMDKQGMRAVNCAFEFRVKLRSYKPWMMLKLHDFNLVAFLIYAYCFKSVFFVLLKVVVIKLKTVAVAFFYGCCTIHLIGFGVF